MMAFLLFQGWYIVTYALGIYHLNLFIAFLSPKVDPSLMEDSGTAGAAGALSRLLYASTFSWDNPWVWEHLDLGLCYLYVL